MNYFELKLVNQNNPELFLEIKGTTTAKSMAETIVDLDLNPMYVYWEEEIKDFYKDYTPEDILRHQLKTAL